MENIVGLKEFRMNVEKYARAARAGTPVIVVRRLQTNVSRLFNR